MTERTTTRRGLIVAAGTGVGGALAGCLTSDDSDDDSVGPNGESNDSNDSDDSSDALGGVDPGDIEARRERMPDPGTEVEWSAVREFRTWLFDDGNETTGRFDYTEDLPPVDEVDSPVLDVFDVYPDRVDGLLNQGTTQVVLGEFDAAALESRLTESDRYDVSDEYHGFAVATGTDDAAAESITVGDDAILLGPGYERPIDAKYGDRERLETVDPWLTHLFETLPDEPLASGAYLTPPGLGSELPEIYCWGTSMPERDPETVTTAFVFDRPDDITGDVRETLETLFETVDDRETEGRTLTMRGTVPELPERFQ